MTITFTDSVTAASCTGAAGIDRTWKATNAGGLTAICTQHISYVDSTAPLISCPADKLLACGADTSTNALGVATATDNCSVPAVTYNDATNAGNCALNYIIAREWKATA